MVLCPVAMAVGCKNCLAVSFCALKSVVGDYQPKDETPTQQQTDTTRGGEEKK